MRYLFTGFLAGLLTLSLLPGIASADPAKFTFETNSTTSTAKDVKFNATPGQYEEAVLDLKAEGTSFTFTFTPNDHLFFSYISTEIERDPIEIPSLLAGVDRFSFKSNSEITSLEAGLILGGHVNNIAGEGQEHRISISNSEIDTETTQQNLASDGTVLRTIRAPSTSDRTDLNYDYAKGLGNGYSVGFGFSTIVDDSDEDVDIFDDRTVSLEVSKSLLNKLVVSASYGRREYENPNGLPVQQNNHRISLGLVF